MVLILRFSWREWLCGQLQSAVTINPCPPIFTTGGDRGDRDFSIIPLIPFFIPCSPLLPIPNRPPHHPTPYLPNYMECSRRRGIMIKDWSLGTLTLHTCMNKLEKFTWPRNGKSRRDITDHLVQGLLSRVHEILRDLWLEFNESTHLDEKGLKSLFSLLKFSIFLNYKWR